MPTVKGREAVKSFISSLPDKLQNNILIGAARAAATVVADEAKARSISDEVDGAIKVATKRTDNGVAAYVQVKGPGAYIAPWLEYGTAPHFIAVDDVQRQGMSVGRINRLSKEEGSSHSLVIGGKFVGATVFHPGARPHPFLRPALDAKEGEAIAKAQGYINARVTKAGLRPTAEGDDG